MSNYSGFSDGISNITLSGIVPLPSGGGGSVTSVTASAPIASSGGATPNISLTGIVPVANGGTGLSSVAGANKDILYNDNGSFGADSNLAWDKSAKSLVVQGSETINFLPGNDTAGQALSSSITEANTVNGATQLVAVSGSATNTVASGVTNSSNVVGAIGNAFRGDGTDNGTLGQMAGIVGFTSQNSGAGGVTSSVAGVSSVALIQQGTVTDLFDFNSSRIQIGGTVTNHYGIYIPDDTATPVKNWLSGKTLFGFPSFSAPTATIDLPGVSASASSAPIKLASGTLMTTPENGAVESDGTNLYWTDNSGSRQTLNGNVLSLAPNKVYVDFLSGDDTNGTGSLTQPWKTLQHAYNSITPTLNEPYVIYVSGGNNDTDGAITAKPNVSIVADYLIQIAPAGFTISGGSTNDGCSFTNCIFLGAFSWIRNDANAISLGLNNTEFFSGPTFQQNGSGTATVLAADSVFVNASFNLPKAGSFFTDCSFLGSTTTFGDVDTSAYYEFLGGYNSSAMSISGGVDPVYLVGFIQDVAFGASMTFVTTGNGTPSVVADDAGLPPTITGTPTISLLSFSQNESYTPSDSSKWNNPQPTNVKEAIDRIAAVVGLTVPIP